MDPEYLDLQPDLAAVDQQKKSYSDLCSLLISILLLTFIDYYNFSLLISQPPVTHQLSPITHHPPPVENNTCRINIS